MPYRRIPRDPDRWPIRITLTLMAIGMSMLAGYGLFELFEQLIQHA
jgi:hypothetical protein